MTDMPRLSERGAAADLDAVMPLREAEDTGAPQSAIADPTWLGAMDLPGMDFEEDED